MRLLVTGGAGFIGSRLVTRLLGQGHMVRVLDHLKHGGQGLLGCCSDPQFELVRGDIRDRLFVRRAIKDVDLIIHLAALVGTPACDGAPHAAVATNVHGTSILVAERTSNQGLLLASTGSVYGLVPSGTCGEEHELSPPTLYGQTKVEAEQIVRGSPNSVIFRLATAFGVSTCMRTDLLLNQLVIRAVRDGQLSIFEPWVIRNFIHIDDICSAVEFAIARWDDMQGDTYNVGGDEVTCTKKQVAELIGSYTGATIHLGTAGRDTDRRDYRMLFEKISSLGFVARRSLEEGVVELVRCAELVSKY